MKTALLLLCAACLAISSRADIYTASVAQARRAVSSTQAAENQSAEGQPNRPATPAAAATAQPMDPVLAATLQSIARLRADLADLGTNTTPTGALTNDLAAAATGNKPSPDTIAKLAADLQAALADKPSLRPAYQKLAQYLHAAANGAHLTAAQFQTVSDAVETILENGSASYESTTGVLDDIKHLARETK